MQLIIVGSVTLLWLGATFVLFLLDKRYIIQLHTRMWLVAPWPWIYSHLLWWSFGDLKSSDLNKRHYAAKHLRSKHPRVIDGLSQTLTDSYGPLRWDAARSLRAIGWLPPADKESDFNRVLEEGEVDRVNLIARISAQIRKTQIQFLSNVLKCHGCSASVPSMFVGRDVIGAPFGKCDDCDLIWCSNCWRKVDRGAFYSHDCPRCHMTLSRDLSNCAWRAEPAAQHGMQPTRFAVLASG